MPKIAVALLLVLASGCQRFEVIGREVEPGPVRGFLVDREIAFTGAWTETLVEDDVAVLSLQGTDEDAEVEATLTFHRGLDAFRDEGRVELEVLAQVQGGAWVRQPAPEELAVNATLIDETWDELASIATERWLISVVATWPGRQEHLTIELLYDRVLYYPPVEDDDDSYYYDC
jgi:hypothetical protein